MIMLLQLTLMLTPVSSLGFDLFELLVRERSACFERILGVDGDCFELPKGLKFSSL